MPITTSQNKTHFIHFGRFQAKRVVFLRWTDKPDGRCSCVYAKGNMFWGEFNEKENGIKSVGFKLHKKFLTMERSVRWPERLGYQITRLEQIVIGRCFKGSQKNVICFECCSSEMDICMRKAIFYKWFFCFLQVLMVWKEIFVFGKQLLL